MLDVFPFSASVNLQLFLTRAHSLSSASNEVNGDTLDSKVGAQGDRDMIGSDPNARMRQNFKNAL